MSVYLHWSHWDTTEGFEDMKRSELKTLIKECLNEMPELSITQLASSVHTFAKQLEKDGYKCKVHVQKMGRGGENGPSYVNLEVSKGSTEYACTCEFVAGGYYAGDEVGRFGDGKSWKTMKAEAMAYIKNELED
jgi:hypothetical protein